MSERAARAARRRLALALRALRDELVVTAAGAEELLVAAQQVCAMTESFARQRSAEPIGELQSPVGVGVPGMGDFRERGPIVGLASVVAPPAELAADMEARLVQGSVEFSVAFEGAPGLVHGGFLAAVLDEALGMATMFAGALCMTGEITLRFLRPTPTRTPLRIVARCDRHEGRRVYTSGAILDGDEATVEARGTFVAVGTERFGELDAERARKAGSGGARDTDAS